MQSEYIFGAGSFGLGLDSLADSLGTVDARVLPLILMPESASVLSTSFAGVASERGKVE